MNEHKIKAVETGSIAEELEIQAGDVLVSVNNAEIEEDLTSRFWRRLDENYT